MQWKLAPLYCLLLVMSVSEIINEDHLDFEIRQPGSMLHFVQPGSPDFDSSHPFTYSTDHQIYRSETKRLPRVLTSFAAVNECNIIQAWLSRGYSPQLNATLVDHLLMSTSNNFIFALAIQVRADPDERPLIVVSSQVSGDDPQLLVLYQNLSTLGQRSTLYTDKGYFIRAAFAEIEKILDFRGSWVRLEDATRLDFLGLHESTLDELDDSAEL